jgi:hypothetical protein
VRVTSSRGAEALPLEIHLLQDESDWWNRQKDNELLTELLQLISAQLPVLDQSQKKGTRPSMRKVVGQALQFSYEVRETRPIPTLLTAQAPSRFSQLAVLPFTLVVWPAATDSLSLDTSFDEALLR